MDLFEDEVGEGGFDEWENAGIVVDERNEIAEERSNFRGRRGHIDDIATVIEDGAGFFAEVSGKGFMDKFVHDESVELEGEGEIN